MSANLDLVRSIYADCERGDFSSVEWADPEIEYVQSEWGMLPRTSSHGPVGMAEAARARLEVLRDVRGLADEYRELNDGRVLVLDRTSGRWKRSGIEFRESTSTLLVGAHLFHVRDGEVTKLVACADRDRALADPGLEE
jgi:ketosteroid isomerase-like protein